MARETVVENSRGLRWAIYGKDVPFVDRRTFEMVGSTHDNVIHLFSHN